MKLTFFTDYEAYFSEYFMAIKCTNDNKYDLLTNKNFKFLFYLFNVCNSAAGNLKEMIINNTFYFIFNKEYQIKRLDYTM